MQADAYDRSDLISMLFRETDRTQRMKTSLCLVAFSIVELDELHRLHGTAISDDAVRQTIERTTRLLRSYDLLGRTAFNQVLIALPGCDTFNGTALAGRIQMKVFATPFIVARQLTRLSACFGIARSGGRSPIIVLREAESALQSAREHGPNSIQIFDDRKRQQAHPHPVAT
jgi:diguanylate cyclase (GGDEF)-like protein